MKPQIFIRAEGGPEIGLGHLVRCMALAQMLKEKFHIIFFCINIPDTLKHDVLYNGFELKQINEETEFFNLISDNIIIVLDGYQFDANYQKQIKAMGAKLVCIDDLHDKEFFSDLIINHSPGIKTSDYIAQPYTRFALGLGYVLLRPVFLKQIKKIRKIDNIETVLICFGGSDPQNLTLSTLQVVLEFTEFKKIIVVTGSAYIPTSSFKSLVDNNICIDHRISLNDQEMLKTMLDAELAVAPSSTILLELFAVGTPVITGYYVENQREASGFYGDHKVALDVGDMNLNYKEKLYKQIIEVFNIDFNNMIRDQKKIMKKTNVSLIKIFQAIYNEH